MTGGSGVREEKVEGNRVEEAQSIFRTCTKKLDIPVLICFQLV